MEIRAPVFVGASVDGFIARANHELDFLPAGGEGHGCTDFVKSVDARVFGRNTYEKVLTFKPWANDSQGYWKSSGRELSAISLGSAPVAVQSG